MLFDENTLMGVSLWLSLPLEWAWRLDAEVVAVVVATAAFSLLFCPRPLNSSLFNEYLQSVKNQSIRIQLNSKVLFSRNLRLNSILNYL